MMISAFQRNQLVLLAPIALLGTFLLSYLVVGKEMNIILQATGLIFLILICFTNISISVTILIFSMLLSPEIAIGATAMRDITIRLDDILLATLTIGWLFRIAIFKDIGFMLKNPLNKPIILFSLLAVLSTTLGILRGDVQLLTGLFFTLKMIEYFFMFSIVVNYITGAKETDRLLTMLFTVFAIVAIYGIFQILTGGDVAAPFEGSAGERNTLGGYIVFMAGLAGGIILFGDSPAEKRVLAIFTSMALIVLLFSMSRSGWLGIVVVLIVLFVKSRQKSAYFVIACLFITILPVLIPEIVQDRFAYTFTQMAHPQQINFFGIRLDTSTSARIFAAERVLQEFMKHPLLGFGITGFMFLDGQFFRTLIEMGALGFAAFIWLLRSVYRIILSVAAETDVPPRLHGVAIGFQAGFWGLMVHALTANTFMIVRIAEPFWFVTGILTVIYLNHHTGHKEQQQSNQPAATQTGESPSLINPLRPFMQGTRQ